MFPVVATRPSSPNSRVVRISNRRVLTGSRGLHYPNTSVVHGRYEKRNKIKKWHTHTHATGQTGAAVEPPQLPAGQLLCLCVLGFSVLLESTSAVQMKADAEILHLQPVRG